MVNTPPIKYTRHILVNGAELTNKLAHDELDRLFEFIVVDFEELLPIKDDDGHIEILSNITYIIYPGEISVHMKVVK